MSRQRSNQSEWKRDCNRSQRRFNKQTLTSMDKGNWRRGRGHDKKKPWRD